MSDQPEVTSENVPRDARPVRRKWLLIMGVLFVLLGSLWLLVPLGQREAEIQYLKSRGVVFSIGEQQTLDFPEVHREEWQYGRGSYEQVTVSLKSGGLSRADTVRLLTLVSQQPYVKELNLHGLDLRDDSLRHLSPLAPSLKTLKLPGCLVSGTALPHLAELPHLTALSLDGTDVTDADLKGLHCVPSLRSLSLAQTGISDAGLANLPSLLTNLNLAGTSVSDWGLRHLQKLSDLQGLSLAHTKFTSDGLCYLEKMSIKDLDISYTDFTLKDIPSLKRLLSLKHVNLSGLPILYSEVQEILNPGVNISCSTSIYEL